MKRRWMTSVFAGVGLFAGGASAADPDTVTSKEEGTKLGLFTSLGYLGSAGSKGIASGSAFDVGLRLAMGRHFALSFDVGYGLVGAQSVVEDRWWLIPSMAFVIPMQVAGRRASLDLGGGVGLGASSGYVSFSTYVNAPFMPAWAFQLVPTARVHAIATVAIKRDLDVFVRADAASLLMSGSGTGLMDTTWLMLSLGAQFRLL